MLKTLQLTNFRKHRTLELNFTEGLQVIRGSNEAGKTTLSEAIGYALFGSKCLRESLSEVVTYGEPEGTLKVRLHLTFDGVDYQVVRGKSGAEVVYGDQRVTGQTETRAFFERLFCCSVDIAKALIIADQNEVRGVLAEGASAASSLVEKLADLSVIEKLVDGVQTHLPSGNVKSTLEQIARLTEACSKVVEIPVDTATPTLTAEISELQAKIDLSERAVPADQDVAKAQVAVDLFKRSEADLRAFEARKAKIVTDLAVVMDPPAVDAAALAQLRVEATNAALAEKRRSAFTTVFPTAPAEWDGTVDTLRGHIAQLGSDIQNLHTKVQQLKLDKRTAEMKRINEKECAFCKKDLTDVPEVIAVNVAADDAVTALTAQVTAAEAELKAKVEEQLACDAVEKCHNKIVQLAGEYWELSNDVPAKPKWKGEPPPPAGQKIDLGKLERELQAWNNYLARRQVLEQELAGMVQPVLPDVTEALALIEAHKAAMLAVNNLQSQMVTLKAKLESARMVHEANLKAYTREVQALEQTKEELKKAKETYDEMLENNELIKKLRDARPQIATQLWGMVLGAISHYFSQIRGVESVLTRDEDGFKVNGKSVKGLSGSTQDALGLAIRMALSKVFLPVVPFVFLDESFSGCDDDREVNGIGTIASAGFTQTFLVTHSDMGDSLADNLLLI